ncbi:MAG TPA: efflux RND transporter periplasmic adaptor subunit [Burkholderiaceae bacterium]|jgi:RND family efflux transporter MFP subunit|nr:efflux RND transporter periplasmic adaptor subunit [Burkholderiaceae bacterium]
MLKRRAFWVAAVALLLVAGVGATISKKRNQPASPAAAVAAAPAELEFLPTDVTEVKPRDLRQILRSSGSLRAVNQAAVKARISGEVREVLVREGEAVKAGQVLVKMDTSEYQARVGHAKGALLAARGQLDIATKTRDNNRALLAKGFISQSAFDNAESQYDIAQANVDSAKSMLDVAQKSLNDTVIRAPISGLVSSRTVQPGEKVSPDNRLLDVVDLRKMEMEAAVPTSDIMAIALGQEVQVTVEGLPSALPGKVTRINPSTQTGSRSILVYIQIDNAQGALRVGMFGEAQLTLAKKTGVLTVPQSAVQSEAANPYVYAIENGQLVQKPVTLGIKGDDGEGGAIEIVKGLNSGVQIVKNNLGNLRTGTVVKFAKAANGTAADATVNNAAR